MEWLKYLAVETGRGDILVNDRKQGKSYTKYPNGQLEYESNYDHEQRHGIQ